MGQRFALATPLLALIYLGACSAASNHESASDHAQLKAHGQAMIPGSKRLYKINSRGLFTPLPNQAYTLFDDAKANESNAQNATLLRFENAASRNSNKSPSPAPNMVRATLSHHAYLEGHDLDISPTNPLQNDKIENQTIRFYDCPELATAVNRRLHHTRFPKDKNASFVELDAAEGFSVVAQNDRDLTMLSSACTNQASAAPDYAWLLEPPAALNIAQLNRDYSVAVETIFEFLNDKHIYEDKI